MNYLLFPFRGELLVELVVSSKSVDSGFDENKSVLRVLILSVLFQVLSDGKSLLDQEVKIFGELGSTTVLLEDSEDLLTSQESDLGDTVLISEDDTDLRRSKTYLNKFAFN